MTDPIARPGNHDEGIEHATEQVVETWQGAVEGKDPAASSDDFARMRDGAEAVATREEQLGQFESTEAGSEATAERRTSSQAGPDA